jgi:hypothetical protein
MNTKAIGSMNVVGDATEEEAKDEANEDGKESLSTWQ